MKALGRSWRKTLGLENWAEEKALEQHLNNRQQMGPVSRAPGFMANLLFPNS